MARQQKTTGTLVWTIIGWTIGLTIFFPIFWTILTSFKTEAEAVTIPPSLFNFDWTLENYTTVQERSNYGRHFWNSVVISIGSTLLGLIVAIPAAWSMAFVPGKNTKGILLWMLSTKMIPELGTRQIVANLGDLGFETG